MRSTRQRDAISEALGAARGFLTAHEIHQTLTGPEGRVGLTTVYRNLQALAAAGEIDVLRSDEGEALYRRCSKDEHHHHLVCRKCGISIELESPEVERWAETVARMNGFIDATHTVEVYGLCARCAAK